MQLVREPIFLADRKHNQQKLAFWKTTSISCIKNAQGNQISTLMKIGMKLEMDLDGFIIELIIAGNGL